METATPILKGKTFLITGASSGIGLAVTTNLFAQGANLWLVSRRKKREQLPVFAKDQSVKYSQVDFSRLNQIEQVFLPALKAVAMLDGCVLCHGFGDFGNIEQFSKKRIETLLNVNLVSYVLLLRHIVPRLKTQRRGKIVVIGSEAALRGAKNGSVYCASKFALRGLMQSLRAECASNGVQTTIINPGMVKTAFFDCLNFEPGEGKENYLLPEEVANSVLMVLQSPDHFVIDEINLSPQKKVVRHKNSNA